MVTTDGLKGLHQELRGRGYLPPFEHSKNLRDTANGVRITFLIAGGFSGDGKPKPVAFPNTSDVRQEFEGIPYAKLSALIELKLASGMTNPQRGKDLVDVQELISVLNLPRTYADSLTPYVREKFIELWQVLHSSAKRYVTVWSETKPGLALFDEMIAAGVVEEPRPGLAANEKYLVTTDPDVARKYDMHDESEFMDLD